MRSFPWFAVIQIIVFEMKNKREIIEKNIPLETSPPVLNLVHMIFGAMKTCCKDNNHG